MHVFSYPCISSFWSGDPDLDPMTLTNKFDLDVLKLDQLSRFNVPLDTILWHFPL